MQVCGGHTEGQDDDDVYGYWSLTDCEFAPADDLQKGEVTCAQLAGCTEGNAVSAEVVDSSAVP